MLIKCPECGKEFSDKAQSCPNCGISTKIALDLIAEKEAKKKEKEKALKNNIIFDYHGTKYDFSNMYKKYINIYFYDDGSRKPLNGTTEKPLLEAFYKDLMAYVPSLTREDAMRIKDYFLWKEAIPFSMDEVNERADRIDKGVRKLQAEMDQKIATAKLKCPRCGSTAVTTGQRGFSLLTGFLGSNKTVNRCGKCGHTWKP